MPPKRRNFRGGRSLVRATLARVAIGAGLLIVGLTFITYRLIFRAVEERGLFHLDQYVEERARREEIYFRQIHDNLTIAARTFTERYKATDPEGYLDHWDTYFMRYPDGAMRSRPEYGNGLTDSTLWGSARAEYTPELKRTTLVLYDTIEELRPAWIGTFRSLYGFTPEQTNIGFDPLLANWVYDTPADWDQNTAEWCRISGPEANPDHTIQWTRSTNEGNLGSFYVSVVLPVYIDGRHVVSFAHDVRFDQLLEDSVRTEIAGMTHMIFREDGRVIVHPNKVAEITGSDGMFSMRQDPTLSALFDAVVGHDGRHFSGFEPSSQTYFAASRLEGPEWFFLTTLPRTFLMQEAFRHAQWVLWSGLGALALLLIVLSATVHRSLALPLRRLIAGVELVGEGDTNTSIAVDRADELGTLADAFNRMARNVRERDKSLRDLNADLERRIEERTKQLESSEGRMWSLIEQAPGAVVVFDADTGLLVAANEWALYSMGLTRDTLRDTHALDVCVQTQEDGRPSADVLAEGIKVALAGETASFEWLHRRFDGLAVPSEVRMRRIQGMDRKLLIASFIDVTRRKEAEARLVEALEQERELGEMKSNFVSMVSHEFRTPLGIISSSAEILERYFDRLPPKERREHLHSVVGATRRLSGLIEEVILLGRVETRRLSFSPAPIDLLSLCSRLADEVISATSARCPIEITASNDLAGACGDESLLRHIISNLLSNAVKYSEADAPVSFTIERSGGDGVLKVRDRGIGIPADDMHHLFTAFHRAANVGSRPGTGLGLVIVQRCVRIHGGEIDVESASGTGTCFTVRLPLFSPSQPGSGNAPDTFLSDQTPADDEDDIVDRG